MSLYLRCLKPKQLLCIHKVLSVNPNRTAGHWFPDYIPGPYPETEEEKKAAAKKYNLLPEEYKPYPNDERGLGDYPDLPFKSVDHKDPYYPWDMPDLRRDYNEPIHQRMVQLLPELLSTGVNPQEKRIVALKFLLMTSTVFLIFYLIREVKYIFPCSEKQYPAPGVVHYTFELDKTKLIGKKRSRKEECEEEDEENTEKTEKTENTE